MSHFPRFLVSGLVVLALTRTAFGETDADLVARVKAAIDQNKLAARPSCLAFDVTRNSDPGVDQVEVLKLHDAACGGDPQVQHRLFEVLVDQKTHRMETDAADPVNGTMKALP